MVGLAEKPGTAMDQLQFPADVEAVLLSRGERYPSPSVAVTLPRG